MGQNSSRPKHTSKYRPMPGTSPSPPAATRAPESKAPKHQEEKDADSTLPESSKTTMPFNSQRPVLGSHQGSARETKSCGDVIDAPLPSSALRDTDSMFPQHLENADVKRIASKSSKETASPDMKISAPNPFDVRATCHQFRILVIGKANAGKTTLLKKVCESADDPEIFSPSGEKIDPKVIDASHRRGEHDITNQLVFKSNPGYIFHDSRGFESGSVGEIQRVKTFIAERAATNQLSEQLHAIWYCLPTDTNRPVTRADEDFFNTGVRGQVPLIAIFTKVDGLEDSAFAQLLNAGYNVDKAMEKLAHKTREMLTTNFRQPLEQTDYPPSEYIQLDDMREKDTSCKELIEKTAATISDDALRMLFVSVQRNNIGLSVRYAVEMSIDEERIGRVTIYTLGYFGHIWAVRVKVSPDGVHH
ncbi:GTP-binding protein [Mycena venus]|uniref:GTP-binding protein n=1 Tax=Mycena venus TaxID=2733690 RepID=A0A8H6X5V9_9AGAR|nr:GTP-binding protein [Mycena venus]